MSECELPDGWDEERVQRVLAHYEGQTEDEAAAEDEIVAEEVIEFRVSGPSPAKLMATWKHLMHAHIGGAVQPKFLVEEVADPAVIARFQAQDERARRNEAWLQSHWSELLPSARGRSIAVAGQEAFIADSHERAREMARAAHPDDDGVLDQYVRPEPGPRIYSLFSAGSPITAQRAPRGSRCSGVMTDSYRARARRTSSEL